MQFLLIDTSTERAGYALFNQNVPIFQKELPLGRTQSHFLIPYLNESLKENCIDPYSIIGIAVGIGPGSYTGIRVGVSVAQTLAYVWKCPLIGFSSLIGFIPEAKECAFSSMIDARIGGIYIQNGYRHLNGKIDYLSEPQLYSLEESFQIVKNSQWLVSPQIGLLQSKFISTFYSETWKWLEIGPDFRQINNYVNQMYSEKRYVYPPQALNILYLKETEAERVKKMKELMSQK